MLVTAQAIGTAVSAAVLILGVAALLIWSVTSIPRLAGVRPRFRASAGAGLRHRKPLDAVPGPARTIRCMTATRSLTPCRCRS